MKNFTVLLLYPDYMSDNFGQDTYLAHVKAEDVKGAQRVAQLKLLRNLGKDYAGTVDPNDYAVLMVIEGHHNDIKEPT